MQALEATTTEGHTADHEHSGWFWPDADQSMQGPAICVDIDGVLADATHRQHMLQSRWRDWDGFFEAAGADGLLAQQAILLDTISDDHVIALVTARPAWISDLTIRWLREHEVRWDMLVMRSNSDFRRSPEMKASAVEALQARGIEPVLAFDDDARNVEAYATLGIPCVYIHSGYHL